MTTLFYSYALRGVLVFSLLAAGCRGSHSDSSPATTPQSVKSAAERTAHCKASSVAIEIIGRDAQGAYIVHGAGTVLHEAGCILTCEHITANGERQVVILPDGLEHAFSVLARAGGSYDTAVLKITSDRPLTPVTMGHSDDAEPGTPVTIIGNPDGRRHTAKHGVLDRVTRLAESTRAPASIL